MTEKIEGGSKFLTQP